MNEKQQVRLQKYFTDCRVMSRRAAEAEIAAGRVTVNGEVAKVGDSVRPGVDTVLYQGKKILPPKEEGHTYLLLNKPRGYVTTSKDPQGRKCVLDLLPPELGRVYPVGRLDLCSEGILLLTDDGELANKLTHPAHTIGKVYRVKVGGEVSPEQLQKLRSALVLDGYRIMPVEVLLTEKTDTGTVLKFTLYEGRNRQIRKMCAAVGLTVKRLNRVSIGELKLNNLAVGKWRYLEEHEVAYLRAVTRGK